MKILLINWQDIKHPLAGGAEVQLQEVFSRIVGWGHSVTMFTCGFPGCDKTDEIDGIKIIRAGKRINFNWVFPFYYFSHFRKQDFDLVVCDVNKLPFFTIKFIRKPLVGKIHHLFGKSIFIEASFPIALYVYVMEEFFVRWVRNIPFIVDSPSTVEDMVAKGFPRKNMHLIFNAVNHEKFRVIESIPKENEPLVGYLGRMKRYKSVDHLLFAFKKIAEIIPAAKLVLVGDGDDRPRLEKIVHELELSNKVQFTGFVSDEEKAQWLNRFWVMVNTSSKEGWGLTVVEANACGTPVIAADSPGLRDAVRSGESGVLYKYGDIGELARAIERVLTDSNYRESLRKGAIEWANRFSWDYAAKKHIEIFEQIIQQHRKGEK